MADHSLRSPAQIAAHPCPSEIARLLADDVVLPLGAASDMFDNLAGLLRAIEKLAIDRKDPVPSLLDIERLAKCGRYLADDFSSYIDVVREKFEDQHTPMILAAVQGEARHG